LQFDLFEIKHVLAVTQSHLVFPVGQPVALQVALLVDVHLGTEAKWQTGFYTIPQESHRLQATQMCLK